MNIHSLGVYTFFTVSELSFQKGYFQIDQKRLTSIKITIIYGNLNRLSYFDRYLDRPNQTLSIKKLKSSEINTKTC